MPDTKKTTDNPKSSMTWSWTESPHAAYDSARQTYMSMNDEDQFDQAKLRAQYGIVLLYRKLCGWFESSEKNLFELGHWEIPQSGFGWGMMPDRGLSNAMRKKRFLEWVPEKSKDIDKIAEIVSYGSYIIDDVARQYVEHGYGSEIVYRKTSDIRHMYDIMAFAYEGRPFPDLPKHGGWDKKLEWFEECRDMLGVVSYLETYAAGVPIDDIVFESQWDLKTKRNEILANLPKDCDEPYLYRFPNIKKF